MPRFIHPLAGMFALATIASFWLSTLVAELFLSEAAVTAVKTAIPWGFCLLVPALAITGSSGALLSRGNRTGLVGAKLKRMPIIAANGVFVLIPIAFVLAAKAQAREFDPLFYGLQAGELIAGGCNVVLLGLNFRDGLKLTRWHRSSLLQPSNSYRTILVGQSSIAHDTVAFRFQKPNGFAFRPGQAVYLTLPSRTNADGEGWVRPFSLASAPHEPNLVIATRLTNSAFKAALSALPTASEVTIEGPYGDLCLDSGTRPVVLLAGGIGITPFRSMIIDAAEHGLTRDMTLFYCNRSLADAAYLAELENCACQTPRLTVVSTLTQDERLQGECGSITRDMIERYAGPVGAAIFFIAGPPAMVSALSAMLTAAGVNRQDIHTDLQPGFRQLKEQGRAC